MLLAANLQNASTETAVPITQCLQRDHIRVRNHPCAMGRGESVSLLY